MAATGSPILDLPDDLLTRVLVGFPREDHDATAAACRKFRAVMSGPLFLRLRREGFAERAVVLLETEFSSQYNTATAASYSSTRMARHLSVLPMARGPPAKPPCPRYPATTIGEMGI